MKTKEFILSKIKAHKAEIAAYGIQDVGLFGSYVRNEQSSSSDIDILISFSEDKASFDNFMAAYDYFEELFKNEKVELVTKNSLSPYIGPSILNEVIYA